MNFTRRKFLIGAGLASGAAVFGAVAYRPGTHQIANDLIDSSSQGFATGWIKLDRNNRITIYVPHTEMGQGVHTALAAMAADELDANWADVVIEPAPVNENYTIGNRFNIRDSLAEKLIKDSLALLGVDRFQVSETQLTAGSTSVRFTGQYVMRTAGAAARELLQRCAAEQWQVPFEECHTESSHVFHADSGQSLPYGELITCIAEKQPPLDPPLKQASEFTLMGRSLPRIDIPAKVDGSAVYGMDFQTPGMLYAAVKFAPVPGTRIESIDSSLAEQSRGVARVVAFENYVAVVADNPWRAERALALVECSYSASEFDDTNLESILAEHRNALDSGEASLVLEASPGERTPDTGATSVSAEYSVPFLAHAALEPVNVTISVTDESVEVWAGIHDPLQARNLVASYTGVDSNAVSVHPLYLGGSFGRRLPAHSNVLKAAAEIASQFDVPVKTSLSREEDFRQDYFRTLAVSRFEGSFNEAGKILSWSNKFTGTFGQVDAVDISYEVGHIIIQHANTNSQIRTGSWRSVDHSQHTFFTESFVDELAHNADIDPLQFRLDLLAHSPRNRNVLIAVSRMVQDSISTTDTDYIGYAFHACFDSVAALAAQVRLTAENEVIISQIHCAIDCGRPINPDIITSQVEGAILMGLSATLFEEIEINAGQVVQDNFDSYRLLRLSQTPELNIMIVPSEAAPGGVGETATPLIAPAICNSIFQATGVRIRHLPVRRNSTVRIA